MSEPPPSTRARVCACGHVRATHYREEQADGTTVWHACLACACTCAAYHEKEVRPRGR